MSKWFDKLPGEIQMRLGECRNIKEDIPVMVNARWKWMQEQDMHKRGFTKEDAIVFIFDLLDSNSQWQLCDISREEYEELKK